MDLEVVRIVHEKGLGPVEGSYVEEFAALIDPTHPRRLELVEEMADELADRRPATDREELERAVRPPDYRVRLMQQRWQLLYQIPRGKYLEEPAARGLVPLPFAILIALIAIVTTVAAVLLLRSSLAG